MKLVGTMDQQIATAIRSGKMEDTPRHPHRRQRQWRKAVDRAQTPVRATGDYQEPYPDCTCTYDRQYGAGTVGDSPIIIDTLGNGFDLTDAASGVNFDLDSDGAPEPIAWTAAGSDE